MPWDKKVDIEKKLEEIEKLEKGEVVKIFNALGELVYTTVTNTETVKIDTQKFASGVYTIEINTGTRTEAKKMVKE